MRHIAFVLTIIFANLASADSGSSNCIDTIHKSIAIPFWGGTGNIYNWLGQPYTLTLSFEKNHLVTMKSNWHFDTLRNLDLVKSVYTITFPYDTENPLPRKFNCADAEDKRVCEAEVAASKKLIRSVRKQAVQLNAEADQALNCAEWSLDAVLKSTK